MTLSLSTRKEERTFFFLKKNYYPIIEPSFDRRFCELRPAAMGCAGSSQAKADGACALWVVVCRPLSLISET